MTERVDRYLRAVGLAGRPLPVNAATLVALLRAHTTTFPYETLGMALGARYPLDPAACVDRALAGRPGYCYTQNTAFAWVLEQLGFTVQRHLGVVTGRAAAEPASVTGGHMALTVDLDGVTWFADAGLGPGPTAAVPLAAGEFTDGPWRHHLGPSPVPGAAWRLTLDPAIGSFRYMDFAAAGAEPRAFVPLHEERRRIGEPGTPYFVVQRPTTEAVEMILGDTYVRAPGTREVLPDAAAWRARVESLGCRALGGAAQSQVTEVFTRLRREGEAFRAPR